MKAQDETIMERETKMALKPTERTKDKVKMQKVNSIKVSLKE